jgi:hypothetical protein
MLREAHGGKLELVAMASGNVQPFGPLPPPELAATIAKALLG